MKISANEIARCNQNFRSANATQGDVWPVCEMGGHERYSERVINRARKARRDGAECSSANEYMQLLEAVASEVSNDSSNW
jgi:hypothetical protein